MYPTANGSKDEESVSIEDEISNELNEMKKPAKGPRMFEAVMPDMPCGESTICLCTETCDPKRDILVTTATTNSYT